MNAVATEINWLSGDLDGYGIVDDGFDIHVFRANGREIGVAADWSCALDLMRNDQ